MEAHSELSFVLVWALHDRLARTRRNVVNQFLYCIAEIVFLLIDLVKFSLRNPCLGLLVHSLSDSFISERRFLVANSHSRLAAKSLISSDELGT